MTRQGRASAKKPWPCPGSITPTSRRSTTSTPRETWTSWPWSTSRASRSRKMLPPGGLPEPEVIRLGRQAAEALEAAHEQGLIHRDLKPGNIMVTPKGLVKLLDFGLAKLLRPSGPVDKTLTFAGTESFSGTLAYMAPEQLEGRGIDQRTDIHALGIILYELATGQRLFPQEIRFPGRRGHPSRQAGGSPDPQPGDLGGPRADHLQMPGKSPGRPLCVGPGARLRSEDPGKREISPG